MATKKQHPHVGKYVAVYEGSENDKSERPDVHTTPEEALEAFRQRAEYGEWDDGDVVYVYAVVGVKKITKPTLTENLVEDFE